MHSKFPVGNGSIDKILGVMNIRDFLSNYKQQIFSLNQIFNPPMIVIQNTYAFEILNIFKRKKQYLGIVVDEFGDTKGIITLRDLALSLMGDLPDEETDELNMDGNKINKVLMTQIIH